MIYFAKKDGIVSRLCDPNKNGDEFRFHDCPNRTKMKDKNVAR